MWDYIYHQYGYRYVLVWIFILTIMVFVAATIGAVLYEMTIGIAVQRISLIIYEKGYGIQRVIEDKCMSILSED